MSAALPGHTASEGTLSPAELHVGPDPLLRVANVSLEYRTSERVVRATHEVGFEVDQRDRFVLLGPSGCGKSTLLKAVAGFIKPAAGEILLAGKVVREPGPDRGISGIRPTSDLENGSGKRDVSSAGFADPQAGRGQGPRVPIPGKGRA